MQGLPDHAATWREETRAADGWGDQERLMAALIEQSDRWNLALFKALRGVKKVSIPGPVVITAPGEPERPQSGAAGKVVRSLKDLGRFIARNS